MAVPPAYSPDFINTPIPNTNYDQQYGNLANADSKFLAFHRAQGASEDQARAETAQKVNSARTSQGSLPGEYADLISQSLRTISDKFENQGMWNSSARLREQNEQQGALEGQMLNKRNAYADTINSANNGLARTLAAGQVSNAAEQQSAADRTVARGADLGMNLLPPDSIGSLPQSPMLQGQGPR